MSPLYLLFIGFCSHISSSCTTYEFSSELYQDRCPENYQNCSDGCPPGLFCNESRCECGSHYPGINILCNKDTSIVILAHYCVTSHNNITFAGECVRTYNQSLVSKNSSYGRLYNYIPKRAKELNDMMCKPLNRSGMLCGRCLPDHYPLAYSFKLNCIPCPNVRWNWVKYIIAAYLPLTLFYAIIVFFKINITSSYLFAVVYYCQTLSMPLMARLVFLHPPNTNKMFISATKLLISVYGIWNLDFFRPFYSDLCLGIGIFPTLALDYAIAVYPILLMIISYLLIVLYDKNYRIITMIWSPFRILFSLFRKNWNIRTSVIDAFSTFFFLTNMKFLSVSFDFLLGTKVYRLQQNNLPHTIHSLYAAEQLYFGQDHWPYVMLATTSLFTFVFLPTVTLMLYPFSIFQKLLNLAPGRWYILHTFVDSFYGCYQDGTQPGTRDCRWFASVFFIARASLYIIYALSTTEGAAVFMLLMMVLHTTLIATLRPFSPSCAHYNTIHVLFLQFLVGAGLTANAAHFSHYIAPSLTQPFYTLTGILIIIPLLSITVGLLYWIYLHRKFGLDFIARIKARIKGYIMIPDLNESLPDRLEHSGRYPKENLSDLVQST